MVSLLLIEDDLPIRESLQRALVQRGHVVATACDGLTGLQSAVDGRPDLVVLDLGLPDIDGRDLLRMLRAVSDVPVIVSTARDDDHEIVGSLDSGADDYVVKPFSAVELEARVRAVLRRGRSGEIEPVIQIGGLRIDRRAHEVSIDDAPVVLTRKEFELLEYLARNAGAVVSKRELLAEVWDQPSGGGERTVDVHLSWLRGKLGESASDPVYLHTVRGVGVRLTAPE